MNDVFGGIGAVGYLGPGDVGSVAPVAATLTIVDQVDGTGATATIAGAVGYTNKIRVYNAGTLAFVNVFTRSGNGQVDLTIATTGRYIAVLTSDDFLAVGPTEFLVTDGTDSYAEVLHDQVLAKIQSLPLAGILLANIKKVKHAIPQISYADTETAGVLVCPTGERIVRKYNTSDDVGYGFLVVFWTAVNQKNNTINLPDHQKWRQQIHQAFNIKPGVAPLAHSLLTSIEVEPASPLIFNPTAFLDHDTDATAQVVRVFIRQPR